MSVRLKRVNVCGKCKAEFHPYQKEQKYCSVVCSRVAAGFKRRKRVKATCPTCGRSFERKQGGSKHPVRFCSKSCWATRKGKRYCKQCGNEFKRHDPGDFCSKACFNKWNHGTNHARWNGGRNGPRARDAYKLKLWRYRVLNRDGHRCQDCGTTNSPLHAHHIKSYSQHESLRFEDSNGITLCISCHEKIHGRPLGDLYRA